MRARVLRKCSIPLLCQQTEQQPKKSNLPNFIVEQKVSYQPNLQVVR
uniref:Uncharacterized protein n=1 Tax=Arundo donax TaxID=35708 RepID=A0A0A9DFG7_ARUDO